MNGDILRPTIPEYVTVHLGRPNESARNVTVPFSDYIKNVASSEIYPTWPDTAIRANLYAQLSFTLNRIYTEYYRSRGYDFDITNSTSIDQSFVYGRDIFENISEIADEIFDSYIRRRGSVEPLFASYCDGAEVQCDGLSQWGTVSLAGEGLTSLDILRYYFGDDIELVTNVPVEGVGESYEGVPLRLGSVGNSVRLVQVRLNRISRNYPGIPKISGPFGYFDAATRDAVEEFQSRFSLTPDGVVGSATWYAIARIYNGVKRITDVYSEGIPPEDVTLLYGTRLAEGSVGSGVSELQYFLSFISAFNESVRPVGIDGVFGSVTRASVEDFQYDIGLPVNGIVELSTWRALYNSYRSYFLSLPEGYFSVENAPYPGIPLVLGEENESVRILQERLSRISEVYTEIPRLTIDGIYGTATRDAVLIYQELFGLTPSGAVGAETWASVAETYTTVVQGGEGQPTQFGGVISR